MPSEWRVQTNYIGDKRMYAVYRLRDTAITDHSGNRELATGYMEDKQEAQAIANKLNKEE